ncbi:serine protease [Cladochytrium tenue]|nr:serine protease [Cladochytrium tenue]
MPPPLLSNTYRLRPRRRPRAPAVFIPQQLPLLQLLLVAFLAVTAAADPPALWRNLEAAAAEDADSTDAPPANAYLPAPSLTHLTLSAAEATEATAEDALVGRWGMPRAAAVAGDREAIAGTPTPTPTPTLRGASSSSVATATASPSVSDRAPGTAIPDRFIISLNDSALSDELDSHHTYVARLLENYNANVTDGNSSYSGVLRKFGASGWNGYSGHFPRAIVEMLRNTSLVEFSRPAWGLQYIEEDRYFSVSGLRANGTTAYASNTSVSIDSQVSPPWGLDRIGRRLTGSSGEGVTIYVLDTGIRVNHTDFGGRASLGENFVEAEVNEDLNGHGTHVAGTAAGATYGVAKAATIISVKVLDSSGTGVLSDVISALEWVVSNATGTTISSSSDTTTTTTTSGGRVSTAVEGAATASSSSSTTPLFVVNLSIGQGGTSQSVNEVVQKTYEAGGVIAVAAGNDDEDACNNSPADSNYVLTVAATAANDSRAIFSNYGSCVSLFAPGVEVESDSYASSSGQATPHVSGVLALVLQAFPSGSPASWYETLLGLATTTANLTALTSSDPALLVYAGVYTALSAADGASAAASDQKNSIGYVAYALWTYYYRIMWD